MLDVCLQGNEESGFGEFRRKVQTDEVLSTAMQRLLRVIRFSGKVTVIVQSGRVLKSGYEESYFRPSVAVKSTRLQ